MSEVTTTEQAAMRGLLGPVKEELGEALSPEWERAFWGVPRHRFVPEQTWLGADLSPCDRATDPDGWLRAVYADDPAVTQINDGAEPDAEEVDGGRRASSSASAPSIVFRMLDLLDVRDGHRVLEIGTGVRHEVAQCK
ncbi:hypothetical protein [Streptomyces sp. NPDC093109]|uniref:hypothetical protein n=1 Tax=Streptomyces sp. NPDC093109 TaxID=3154977 RepID=UPI003450BB8A